MSDDDPEAETSVIGEADVVDVELLGMTGGGGSRPTTAMAPHTSNKNATNIAMGSSKTASKEPEVNPETAPVTWIHEKYV